MDHDANQVFEFRLDAQFRAESGTTDIVNGIRLAFWLKDHWVGELERRPNASHPVLIGFARAAELLLVDIPLASEITVLPHELFGHGGRIREFGGEAAYHFELPPPYSFAPSYTHTTRPIPIETLDARLLVSQAGIAVEHNVARASLRASFASGTLNHIDSGLLVGEPIHEVVEAAVPWPANDVDNWTSLQGTRYRRAAKTLQREYLLATAVTNLVNPTFLYSCYDLFWRFLVLGRRTGPMPSLGAGSTALWANAHVNPMPWGFEVELDLLARRQGIVLEVVPHWGAGPGGCATSTTFTPQRQLHLPIDCLL
jgi:hypothetical protein